MSIYTFKLISRNVPGRRRKKFFRPFGLESTLYCLRGKHLSCSKKEKDRVKNNCFFDFYTS